MWSWNDDGYQTDKIRFLKLGSFYNTSPSSQDFPGLSPDSAKMSQRDLKRPACSHIDGAATGCGSSQSVASHQQEQGAGARVLEGTHLVFGCTAAVIGLLWPASSQKPGPPLALKIIHLSAPVSWLPCAPVPTWLCWQGDTAYIWVTSPRATQLNPPQV